MQLVSTSGSFQSKTSHQTSHMRLFLFLNLLPRNETEREMVESSKQPVECSNHSGGVQSETDFLA